MYIYMYVDTHIICIHVFECCRFCHLLDFTELEYGPYSNVMTRKSTLSTDMCIHCHRGLCTAVYSFDDLFPVIPLSHSRGHGDTVEVASVTLEQGGGGIAPHLWVIAASKKEEGKTLHV